MSGQEDLVIAVPEGGFAKSIAVEAIRRSGLPGELARLEDGPFGHSSRTLALLEVLVDAVDLALLAADRLEGLVLEESADPSSFSAPRLEPAQRQLVGSFAVVVLVDVVESRRRSVGELPKVEGSLELDGLEDLLEGAGGVEELLERVIGLGRAFLLRDDRRTAPSEPDPAEALVAFFLLLKRAVVRNAEGGPLRPLMRALESRQVIVGARRYDGLRALTHETERAGLLPVQPSQIVGNDEYLQAGLRLARDVAGYDLEQGRSPKKLNPILFGLGPPGCGKTVTAHAVGNYFLDYCGDRGVPARFVVVRRTDWASSYQNASASNLVRIFRDEVYGFEGVCGVYWPDIDTAFASRAASDLRIEEKQNLAAVFGVFDGTLLPRDGKWFLLCDANTLHMDEATVSRIAQSPHTIHGPKTVEDYVALMRDVLLGDLRAHLPAGEGEWQRIGSIALRDGLSGRSVESVSNDVRARIQDFEYPEEYFAADFAEREKIVARLARTVSEGAIVGLLEKRAAFESDAAQRAEDDAFEHEVGSIVRHLNASREAAERASSGEGRRGEGREP